MPTYGGMSPYPRRFGGGGSRVKTILDGLNADRGTALDATNRLTTVYVINMAIARAIAAAWGTNQRIANMWAFDRCSVDVLKRWETILAIVPDSTDTVATRRARVANIFARFGQATVESRVLSIANTLLGSMLVGIEYISVDNANIQVPDATYPFGVVGAVPWASTVGHVLLRLQKPTGFSEGDFYLAAAATMAALDPILPAWTTLDWYRPGPVSVNVGGPTAGGFYLNDAHNLDNEVFAENPVSPPSVVRERRPKFMKGPFIVP